MADLLRLDYWEDEQGCGSKVLRITETRNGGELQQREVAFGCLLHGEM